MYSHIGIGKTTLANEICVKWARDGFLTDDFSIVILIALRTVQQRKLEEVVKRYIGEQAYLELKDSQGDKCLIILEGLDEMSVECRQNDPLLVELVEDVTAEFVKARVLVTSRPNACQEFKANRTIEIIGLGEKEIMEFVQSSFPGDTESIEAFSKQLDEYPQLYSLCYIPMSLVMIVRISKYNQQTLPSTLTELYRLFIVMTLIREEKKNLTTKHFVSVATPVNADEKILCEVFTNIPSGEIQTILALCKLAYCSFFEWHTITEQRFGFINQKEPKIIFTELDLFQSKLNITDNFDGYGLLQVETMYHLTGDHVTYNFLHLTVQEFLCAVYMLTLSQERQYYLFQQHFHIYPNLIILYCGLTRLDFHQVVYSKLTSPSSTVTAVKCLYEGQWNPHTAIHILTSSFALDMNDVTLLPYECHCVSYVCCHYAVTHLNMEWCYIGDKNAAILVWWCLNKSKTTKLQELKLYRNKLTSEGIKYVMKVVTSWSDYCKAQTFDEGMFDELLVIYQDLPFKLFSSDCSCEGMIHFIIFYLSNFI